MRVVSFFVAVLCIATLTIHAAPPSIVYQPADESVDSGTFAEFYAAANGTNDGIPYYQWYRDGAPVSGASGFNPSAYLYITNVMSSDAGDYFVIMTNRFGSATSQVAHLTVLLRAPVITADPAGAVVCGGQSLNLSAVALGSHPLSYQWQLNGTNLPAGNGRVQDCDPFSGCDIVVIWSIPFVDQSNAGDYRAVFTNNFGARTTAVARIAINTSPPNFASMTTTQLVLAGDPVQLFANVSSCGPVYFRWQRNGIEITGDDTSSLYLPHTTTNDAGIYSAIAINNYGSSTGIVAHLTISEQAPEILQDPMSQTIYAGGKTVFSVSVRAGPPADFQWRFNGTKIPSETNSTLYVYTTSTNQAGAYSVVATNYLGSVTSAVALLTILEYAPFFQTEPLSQDVVAGFPVTFTAYAQAAPLASYQWRFNGTNIPGATNTGTASSIVISSASTNDAGDYTVVAMNEAGSVTSRVATLIVSPPGPLDRWQWRNPLPQGLDLSEVGYGNGTFVALGAEGTKVSSHDGGISWHDRSEGSGWAGGVTYGNGIFVRAGYDYLSDGYHARIETSPDGIVWTNRAVSTQSGILYDVAFGNGRFVTVGDRASLFSTNGIDWTVDSSAPTILRVAFGNGRFVGVSSGFNNLFVSTNGESWTTKQSGFSFGYITDICFGLDQFVVCGSYYNQTADRTYAIAFTSADAQSWSLRNVTTTDFQPFSIAEGNGRFVMVGGYSNGLAAVSSDGSNWTTTNVLQSHQLFGVGFGGGTFVAVGNYGNIITSTNGLNWAARSAGTDLNLRGISRGAGTYVAMGNEGLLLTSSTGISWKRQSPPTTNNLRSVTFGHRPSGSPLFAAVGEADPNSAVVMTSSNGVAWARVPVPPSLGLYGVTFADGVFVAVGDVGLILASSDGQNWSVVHSSGERLNAVTHAAGMFVAVGRNGTILVSGSGSIWAARSSGTSAFLQGVAYGNGRFVAGGRGSIVAISTNGAQWTAQASGLIGGIEDITFANNLFVAVGDNGLIASSPDGVTWTAHRSAISHPNFRGVMYADGRFLAVGNNEAILQSGFIGPPVLRVRHFADDGFEFSVDGEVGRNYRVQGSSNLRNWIDLGTFSNNEETTLFLDSDVEDFLQRFYRVVSP